MTDCLHCALRDAVYDHFSVTKEIDLDEVTQAAAQLVCEIAGMVRSPEANRRAMRVMQLCMEGYFKSAETGEMVSVEIPLEN